MKERIRKLLWF